ncbi:MAG: SufD family Fe-S cluster assembly protein [Dehalococcoidia bacterium]|nr:SufD family Fe-S cluster assembly protein [Dehalococcoidia bacterium]
MKSMISYSVEKEYQGMLDAYEKAGGDKSALQSKDVARLVVHENRVLSTNGVKGIKIETKETETGVNIYFLVEEGVKIKRPIHLCFGILPKEGLQEIILKVNAQDNSEVNVIAHCIFPNAVKVIHKMDAEIDIGNNAKFDYKETHYHGEFGGIEVIPKARVNVGKGGVWQSTFTLSQGLVGKLDYDFEVFCQDKAVAELVVKAYGKKDDDIKVWEKIYLNGIGARGLAKSRLVLSDRAKAEVKGETYGNAAYARGHVDCIELVNGTEAVARAIPIVSVTNDKAKVTHEAAIGSIDKKQVETLMARGLDESEAVDVIVRGILR